MSTKGTADVVFCLDASNSMSPCLQGVKDHLTDFVKGLQSKGQMTWDLRADFVAQNVGQGSQGGVLFNHRSVYHEDLHEALYASRSQSGARLFTTALDDFKANLDRVRCEGDEAMLVALDFALDFPWRPAVACHRTVILLTDEPCETGAIADEQAQAAPALIRKIQDLRVMLFLVAPDSPTYQKLAEADKSEYEVISEQQNGLASVDFGKVLQYIGKSVSAASLQPAGKMGTDTILDGQNGICPHFPRGLFGQTTWKAGTGGFQGR
jgi:hypothetical protein